MVARAFYKCMTLGPGVKENTQKTREPQMQQGRSINNFEAIRMVRKGQVSSSRNIIEGNRIFSRSGTAL